MCEWFDVELRCICLDVLISSVMCIVMTTLSITSSVRNACIRCRWISRTTSGSYSIFHIPSFTFHLSHSIFHIPSFIFHPSHSIFHIPSFIFHPSHSIFHIPSFIFHLSYSILHIPSFIFHLSYSIFHIPSFTFHLSYSIFHIPSFIFHLSYSILHIPSFIFHLSYSIFHIPSFTFHLSYSIFHIPSFIFHLSYSIILICVLAHQQLNVGPDRPRLGVDGMHGVRREVDPPERSRLQRGRGEEQFPRSARRTRFARHKHFHPGRHPFAHSPYEPIIIIIIIIIKNSLFYVPNVGNTPESQTTKHHFTTKVNSIA